VAVATPTRPVSSAGLDGVATPVTTTRVSVAALVARHGIDDVAGADWKGPERAAPIAAVSGGSLEVSPAAPVEAGVLDGVVAAILGFLFH
jgi:hypothetical protein